MFAPPRKVLKISTELGKRKCERTDSTFQFNAPRLSPTRKFLLSYHNLI